MWSVVDQKVIVRCIPILIHDTLKSFQECSFIYKKKICVEG